ncbi:MAG: hypothetical protein H6821_00355 [Planctomycetaceae bacterium]|nr:hypothetical protein [Planctomycetales bacterium]MCB9872601.1 hypothetical protein [Planctomycetaceae bacterium]MCB9939573.1 hypothetical protein [Planctomycetaceae bacterium]HRX79084.1 hypothetical protein [Pirellulaceae bacterium]
MSIYDQIPDQSHDPKPSQATFVDPLSESPKKKRSGCATCLIVLLGLMFVGILLCGLGTWYVVKKAPDWARNAIVSGIEGSDLTDEDKQIVTEQVDRVVDEYKAGRVSIEQLVEISQELSNSPLLTLMMAMAAEEAYVKPSGLSDEEKEQAERTFERVARGVFEKQIETDELNTAMDFVSTVDSNGNRQFKSPVADEDLRLMLAELKRLSDEAEIPDEPYQVNVGAEFKAAVDRVLSP